MSGVPPSGWGLPVLGALGAAVLLEALAMLRDSARPA